MVSCWFSVFGAEVPRITWEILMQNPHTSSSQTGESLGVLLVLLLCKHLIYIYISLPLYLYIYMYLYIHIICIRYTKITLTWFLYLFVIWWYSLLLSLNANAGTPSVSRFTIHEFLDLLLGGRYRRPPSNLFAQEIWYEVVSHLPLQKSRAPFFASKVESRISGGKGCRKGWFWCGSVIPVATLKPVAQKGGEWTGRGWRVRSPKSFTFKVVWPSLLFQWKKNQLPIGKSFTTFSVEKYINR